MKAYQQYKRLQGIGAIRMRLGLSQEVFALQLGVSRSLLSKVESKKRSLPIAALSKLSEMEISLHGTTPIQEPATKAEAIHPTVRATAENYTYVKVINYELEIQRLQHKLKQMEITYSGLGKSLECLERLIATGNCNKVSPGNVYLQIQCFTLFTKRTKCGLPAQATLRQRIILLQAASALEETRGGQSNV